MITPFHKKLQEYCRISHRGDQHWILIGAETVRIPDTGEIVTVKRAIYASFVGDVPENMDVAVVCGVSQCAAPKHLSLAASRRKARPLSLPQFLDAFMGKTTYVGKDPKVVIPKGLDLKKAREIEVLAASGTPIVEIAGVTGLTSSDIVRLRSGVYDGAMRKVTDATKARLAKKPAKFGASEDSWLVTVGKG